MSHSTLDELLQRLHQLQTELESEIDRILEEKRKAFSYNLQKGKVKFEKGIAALHRSHKIDLWPYIKRARLSHVLSAPIIYSIIIPFVLLDFFVTVYQHICFRIYGIPRVKRSRYIIIDRQHLAYLNLIEKFNCIYCGYGNGLIEYVREVTARTEQYWCPIKHANRTPDPHRLFENFSDYGDAENFRKRLKELRDSMPNIDEDS